jgi:hypothetical protein
MEVGRTMVEERSKRDGDEGRGLMGERDLLGVEHRTLFREREAAHAASLEWDVLLIRD